MNSLHLADIAFWQRCGFGGSSTREVPNKSTGNAFGLSRGKGFYGLPVSSRLRACSSEMSRSAMSPMSALQLMAHSAGFSYCAWQSSLQPC